MNISQSIRTVIGNMLKLLGAAFFLTPGFIGDDGLRSASIADIIGMDSYIFTPVWIVGGFLLLIFGFYIEIGEPDDEDNEEKGTESE